MAERFLAEIEHELRRAVASLAYADVERLIKEFCGAAAAQAAALPQGDPEIGRLVRHVDEVLDWAHLMLSTARAACVAELTRISILHRYLAPGGHNPPAMRFEG